MCAALPVNSTRSFITGLSQEPDVPSVDSFGLLSTEFVSWENKGHAVRTSLRRGQAPTGHDPGRPALVHSFSCSLYNEELNLVQVCLHIFLSPGKSLEAWAFRGPKGFWINFILCKLQPGGNTIPGAAASPHISLLRDNFPSRREAAKNNLSCTHHVIIRNTFVFVSGSWHRAAKTLVISKVIGAPLFLNICLWSHPWHRAKNSL